MKTRLTLLFLLPAFLTLGACAEEEVVDDYGATDVGVVDDGLADADAGLATPTSYWTTWNVNNDTYLDENEFITGVEGGTWWNDWDLNDDTYLDENEFTTAYSTEPWYSDGLYSTWDTDSDGLLTSDEWGAGLFDTWDADNDSYLVETEYDDGIFS